jgi:hypothetical protein
VIPEILHSFADELEKIAVYRRAMKFRRLFGKIKRMHKKKRVPHVHKRWKVKKPGSGGGGGGSK